MKQPIVELTDVCLRTDRGWYVFDNLNLTVESGRSVVIVGSAGSGKTTLVELLVGLRSPDSGSVKVFGQRFRRHSRRTHKAVRRKVGGVGEPFDLIPSLTVTDNIMAPMVISGERKGIQRERLLKMLSEFSLLKLAGKYPGQLTRVERNLVLFARASVANQPLLIIDEPSAGLDPKTYRRVFEYLAREALSGRSMLILMSEHPAQQIPNTETLRLENGVLE